jgi:hypothetical protein
VKGGGSRDYKGLGTWRHHQVNGSQYRASSHDIIDDWA